MELLPKPISPPKKAPEGMIKFTVYRLSDQSGVSGSGIIAQGVKFATGDIAVQWLTPAPNGDLQIKRSLDDFLNVHVHPHPENITVLTFEDSEANIYPEVISRDDFQTKTFEELQEIVKAETTRKSKSKEEK